MQTNKEIIRNTIKCELLYFLAYFLPQYLFGNSEINEVKAGYLRCNKTVRIFVTRCRVLYKSLIT